MSNNIGDFFSVGPALHEQEEGYSAQQEGSRDQEPDSKVEADEPRQQPLSGLSVVFTETAGNGEGPSIARVPSQIATQISRTLSLADRQREKNCQQALQRLQTLFAEKPADVHQQDIARSTATIDHYLNNNTFASPVPPEVRELMITLDEDTHDVHKAIPYGRGNVLIKNDATESGEQGSIDHTNTFEKARLKFLGEKTYPEIEARSFERPIQMTTKQAGLAILTGAASCVGYVHTLALVVARRCNQSNHLKAKTHLQIYNNPRMDTDKPRVDHVYAVMHYTDTNNKIHKIVLDPWADKNRVILEEHSQYKDAFAHETANYWKQVDRSTIDLVSAHMKNASANHLQRVGTGERYKSAVNANERRVQSENDPAQHYDLRNTLAGYVDAPVNNAKPEVNGAPARRPTLIPAKQSPLLSED
jgi:hypothetical protein